MKTIKYIYNDDEIELHIKLNFPNETNKEICHKLNELCEIYNKARELKIYGMWEYEVSKGITTELNYKKWRKAYVEATDIPRFK